MMIVFDRIPNPLVAGCRSFKNVSGLDNHCSVRVSRDYGVKLLHLSGLRFLGWGEFHEMSGARVLVSYWVDFGCPATYCRLWGSGRNVIGSLEVKGVFVVWGPPEGFSAISDGLITCVRVQMYMKCNELYGMQDACEARKAMAIGRPKRGRIPMSHFWVRSNGRNQIEIFAFDLRLRL